MVFSLMKNYLKNEVNAHWRYMPDKFLWSNDAKLWCQDAFDILEAQNKLNEISDV